MIVNWNGWSDTIERLESVLRSDYPHYRVLVCDNGSDDGSPAFLQGWADGRLDVLVSRTSPLRHLTFPPLAKPVRLLTLDRAAAEAGDPADEEYFLFMEEIDWAVRGRPQFTLTYAPNSLVYHKQGRSSGLRRVSSDRSELAEYHLARSRLVFTRAHHPRALAVVYATLLGTAAARLLAGRPDLAKATLRAMATR